LVEECDTYIKDGTAFFPGSSLAGNGLLVSDGDMWRRQRQLSAPAFRKAAIDVYAAAMVRETAELLLVQQWSVAPAVRDVYADFNELTLSIVLRALFGAGVTSWEARELTGAIRTAFEFFGRRAATAFIVPEFVPTPDNLQFGAAVSRLDKAVYSLISRRRR
jgi:cytochrome P450